MVNVEIVGEDTATADAYEVVSQVILAAVSRLLGPSRGDSSVSIRIADDDEISALHTRFFDNPDLTDVMSFPSGDDLDGPNRHLGDIAISMSVACFQAAEHGHSPTREIAFLALHGLLHLLGHNDTDEVGRQRMMELQTELLEAFEREHGAI